MTTSEGDYATVAYRAGTGTRVWVRRYNGPGNGADSATAIAASPGGGTVFVTGNSPGTSTIAIATIAYDAKTGAQLWVRRVSDSTALSLAVSPDGRKVFAAGTSGGGAAYTTVAYDAATGARLWVRHYPGGAARAVAVSPDARTVFVTGNSPGATANDYATVAYDAASGKRLWASRYDGAVHGDDFAFVVAASPDGRTVFVSGDSEGAPSGENDFATVAYDATTGAQLWVTRYDSPGNGDDHVHSIAVSPDGTALFVTGAGGRAGKARAYTTIAYNTATGANLWRRRYALAAHIDAIAYSVAVSPSGKTVYVTGDSPGRTAAGDYAILAYRATTGDRLWVKRYNGPANGADAALALTVSHPGMRLFVTGFSQGQSSDRDYFTIAYHR